MKRTSHSTRSRHPRRKPIPGLTPEDVVKQMAEEARGKNLRKVRRADQPEGQVLPEARPGGSGGGGEERLFAAPLGDDSGRPRAGGQAKVSDDQGGTQISRILKRMLGEVPPPELLNTEDVGRVATNAEALAAVILAAALKEKQWAVEMVRDQTEGKPVRAAQIDNSDHETEVMLDRVSQAQLNQIAKGK